MRLKLSTLWLVVALSACPPKKLVPPDPPSGRCEVKLTNTGFFSGVGSGAQAKLIESADDLIGGGYAKGVKGDYLLSNDRIRVVIQAPSRAIAPAPYGGTIIDADTVHAGPGRDTLGKIEVLTQFGRSINVSKVEVLDDGSKGGFAVIAATGDDAVIDYFNAPNVIDQFIGSSVKLVADPNTALPNTATTYYVLSPGENRVRVLTAFCKAKRSAVGLTAVRWVGSLGCPSRQTGCSGPPASVRRNASREMTLVPDRLAARRYRRTLTVA